MSGGGISSGVSLGQIQSALTATLDNSQQDIYVSPVGQDNNSGSLPASALATVAAAVTKLGVSAGKIQLLTGAHTLPTGGLAIGHDQSWSGAGMATHINGPATGSPLDTVVTIKGGRSELRDCWVVCALDLAIGVKITNSQTGSTEGVRISNILVTAQRSHCVAFGIGSDTAGDVSEIILEHCISGGNNLDSVHILVGNGGTGNVLDAINIGGNSQDNGYGIWIRGGALISHGLNFQGSVIADIAFAQPGVGASCISGGRSENAFRFCTFNGVGAGYQVAKVSDYSVIFVQNTDGQGIQVLGGPIVFENIYMNGATVPQYIHVGTGFVDNDIPNIVEATDCIVDHPHPFQSNWSRKGKVIKASGTKITTQFNTLSHANVPDKWVRRINITSGSAVLLWPFLYDGVEIRLSANAGSITLPPGRLGQIFSITFVQDGYGGGVGGFTYTWPAQCGFSSGAPANVLTARNRQYCDFRWNGKWWEQYSAVLSNTPPSPVPAAFTADFTGPSTKLLAAPWEHLPGGGSFGVDGSGNVLTLCTGYVGDADSTDNGLFGTAAAAWVDGGKAACVVSATFTWWKDEGLLLHGLDDQTFMYLSLSSNGVNGQLFLGGWENGVNYPWGGDGTYLAPSPGSVHTITATLTSNSISAVLDSQHTMTNNFSPSHPEFIGHFCDLTKHGIVSSDKRAIFTAFSIV